MMKKAMCVLLSVMLCVTMLLSGTVLVSGETTEYIRTDKTTYKQGEFIQVSWQFDSAESNRIICFYRGMTGGTAIRFTMSATGKSGTAYAPRYCGWTWHGGGDTTKSIIPADTYIMKVMYLKAGAASTSAPDYVEGPKSNLTYTFTVTANTVTTPSISIPETEVTIGEKLYINYSGAANTLFDKYLRVELQDSTGTAVRSWNIWNGGSEYAGLSGTLECDTTGLAAGTYTAKLLTDSTAVTLGTSEVAVTLKPVVGTITTDKATYTSGELFKITYEFDTAESNRYICIYKNSVDALTNLIYLLPATGLSGSYYAPRWCGWTWHGGGAPMLTQLMSAGTYILRPMYLNAGAATTSAPDYVTGSKSGLTYSFTVTANNGSTAPAISAEKTELESGEALQIAFDGVTNKLSSNTLKIDLKDAGGTVVKSWNLWDGDYNYAGLNGTVSCTDTLAGGTYTAELICSDTALTLGNSEIVFTVEEAAETGIDYAQPVLTDSIAMEYGATVLEDAESVQMKFTFLGNETVVDGIEGEKNSYTFALPEILPQQMGENIKSELIVDGKVVQTKEEYSVKEYCMNKLEKAEGEFRTLLITMLNYGAAAQVYFDGAADGLVNKDITDVFSPFDISEAKGVIATPLSGTVNDSYKFKSATIGLFDQVSVRFKFAASDLSNLTVEIGDKVYTAEDFTSAGTGLYCVEYADVLACEYAKPISAVIKVNGEPVGQTVTYSVNTYLKNKSESASVGEIVQAVYDYGYAAAAYVSSLR